MTPRARARGHSTKVSADTIVSTETIVQWLAIRGSSLIDAHIGLELAMATLLTKSAYGRILLHIATMICDGEVRWHCAGISRELSR